MPVDQVAQVMQLLRRQMAENLQRMPSGTGPARTPAAPAPRSTATGATPQQSAARRIKAIAADDPRQLEKATLVFVESVLQAEFGAGFANDPAFHDLTHQVQQAMLADAELERDLGRLAAQMRAS